MHHLYGVDNQYARLQFIHRGDNRFYIGFGHQAQRVCGQAESFGAHGDLLQRLLARDIQGIHGLRQMAHGLEQEGTLARSGVATDQNRRAGYQPATQYPVKLPCPRRNARHRVEVDFLEHSGAIQSPGETLTLISNTGSSPARALCRTQPNLF